MEAPQHVESLFVFEAGSINTIIKDNHGTIYTNRSGESVGEKSKEPLTMEMLKVKVDTPSIPKSMNGKGVTSFFEKLKRDGILDENLQPKVSNRNASILADYVGSKFKIRTKWKDFAELWGMDKEVLRSTFNNITNNDEDKAFYKRLAKL